MLDYLTWIILAKDFWKNPKYKFTITQSDLNTKGFCSVIISLIQKYTRQRRKDLGELHFRKKIRFCLYKVKDESIINLNVSKNTQNNQDITNYELIGTSGSFNEVQEVSTRFNLGLGTYIVEACVQENNMNGEFLLRFFSEKPNKDG